jgi:flagellar biosynthesis/type III secretory pathway M-ring protein FliF/YscJ
MSQDTMLWLLRLLFAGAAVVVLIAFVVRPVLRMVRQRPDMDLLTPDFSANLEGEELELPNEAEGEFDRNAAITQARADPRATALRVQAWLKQKR